MNKKNRYIGGVKCRECNNKSMLVVPESARDYAEKNLFIYQGKADCGHMLAVLLDSDLGPRNIEPFLQFKFSTLEDRERVFQGKEDLSEETIKILKEHNTLDYMLSNYSNKKILDILGCDIVFEEEVASA